VGLCQVPANTSPDNADDEQNTIIFISDTQAPMWFEQLFVKTHRNEEATTILLHDLARDSTLSAVFFMGDITAMGSIDHNWTSVDTFLLQLSRNHIPAYAVSGNHDYLLFPGAGLSNLKKRFPSFIQTGYTVQLDNFAVILLNSNFDKLTNSEEKFQQAWYLKELCRLEEDTTIQFIVVGCHHSPFSNSSIVGYSQQVRNEFVPPFLQSTKCKLFVSGHAHTFQHFKDSLTGKHFLVIGGGGGLLHTLRPANSDEYQDQVRWNSEYRLFHYLYGMFSKDTLRLTVKMLSSDLSGPNPVYEVDIPIRKGKN
jgi:predicted MPP superfamily phosphohydrolase